MLSDLNMSHHIKNVDHVYPIMDRSFKGTLTENDFLTEYEEAGSRRIQKGLDITEKYDWCAPVLYKIRQGLRFFEVTAK